MPTVGVTFAVGDVDRLAQTSCLRGITDACPISCSVPVTPMPAAKRVGVSPLLDSAYELEGRPE